MVTRRKLGLGFGENLSFDDQPNRAQLEELGGDQELIPPGKRVGFFKVILALGFVVLFVRTSWLMAVKGSDYRQMADQNRVREVVLRAPRGLVRDRTGSLLVMNVPIFRLEQKDGKGSVTGYSFLTKDEAIARDANGLPVWTDPGRSYPLGAAAAQVVGYVSEVGADELANDRIRSQCGPDKSFELGDFVGRGGLEQRYDCVLRGVNGKRVIEADTAGRAVRVLGEQPPTVGRDIGTSLDNRLEQAAAQALGNRDGAVVAMEASTGAVLAMVSSPSFDPNVFLASAPGRDEQVTRIVSDPEAPLLNRGIGGAYPAGSIFKMVVATAALSEGKITSEFTFTDPGVISAGNLSFSNWYYSEYGRTEGTIGVVRALTRSTDTFFYQVGAMTGPEAIAEWAGKYGYGSKTGIDIPGEVEGLIPTPQWKMRTQGEAWYLGNTYNMAIGQGDVLVTPLQITQATQVIANGGTICSPHLLSGVKAKCQSIGVSPDVLSLVTAGMVGACSPGGTAFPLFGYKPQVACKTGTAQFGVEGKLTHAWLTGFAPVDRPQIVVTALVEGGGEGSAIAAPVAKAVFDAWFKND